MGGAWNGDADTGSPLAVDAGAGEHSPTLPADGICFGERDANSAELRGGGRSAVKPSRPARSGPAPLSRLDPGGPPRELSFDRCTLGTSAFHFDIVVDGDPEHRAGLGERARRQWFGPRELPRGRGAGKRDGGRFWVAFWGRARLFWAAPLIRAEFLNCR